MIEIEGLPEGWKAVAYRVPNGNIEFVFIENVVRKAKPQDKKCLIVEKIQPREIERFDENALNAAGWAIVEQYNSIVGGGMEGRLFNNLKQLLKIGISEYLRLSEVKETDTPLNNSEPKLSLNVKELRNVRSLIKDFENLGWFINPERALLLQKITEFINDK